MILLKVYNFVFVVVGVSTLMTVSLGAPDSAGTVEMIDGLAYGGIPYGSVSGMLKNYHSPLIQADTSKIINQISNQGNQQYYQGSASSPIIVTPNLRASGLERRQRGPVQIYRLTGVIAPGVVGTFSQIGY